MKYLIAALALALSTAAFAAHPKHHAKHCVVVKNDAGKPVKVKKGGVLRACRHHVPGKSA